MVYAYLLYGEHQGNDCQQINTRHTHSVNASYSYEVHEDIICIHTNDSLEDVALL